MQLREERDLLHQRVDELEARIVAQEREYLESPIETD
jgi:BMFP domain-containing protein YqiC